MMTYAALADGADPQTVVVISMAPSDIRIRRIPLGVLPPHGWEPLARIDRLSPWDMGGRCKAALVPERGRRKLVVISRAFWENMDPLYRGNEHDEGEHDHA